MTCCLQRNIHRLLAMCAPDKQTDAVLTSGLRSRTSPHKFCAGARLKAGRLEDIKMPRLPLADTG